MTSTIRALVTTSILISTQTYANTCLSNCSCDRNSEVINCQDGKFEIVPQNVPITARNLNLNNNKISELTDFGDLSNLISLSVENNNLNKIHFDVFDNMDNLQILKLKNNALKSLDDDVFEWNPLKLEVIDLSNNKFKFVQHFLFYDLEKLQDIDLSGNEISFIHPHAFQQLKELLVLWLGLFCFKILTGNIIFTQNISSDGLASSDGLNKSSRK